MPSSGLVNLRSLTLLTVFAVLAGGAVKAQVDPPTVSAALRQADRLFKQQHWAEAAARYDAARDRLTDWHAPAMRRAVEGAVACSAKLTRWDDVVSRLEAYIDHNADSLDEVTGQRLLADFYLSMPHLGVVQGGRFMRGENSQGPSESVEANDGREAVKRLERARDVAARLAADHQGVAQAWIDTDFDLAAALTHINVADSYPSLDRWLGVRLPPGSAAGSEDGKGEPPSTRSFDYGSQERCSGIPPRPDGTPTFATLPPSYHAGLTPAEKFFFLLTEVERLDTSAHHDAAANAVFRRAMAAQRFYGPQTAEAWVDWWQNDRAYHPYHESYGLGKLPSPPVPTTPVWQLGDDQALTPVGNWLRLVDLPVEESPLALLAAAEARYPQSTILPEVRYARALYLHGRQQYSRALAEYRVIAGQVPAGPRAKDARAQIQEIEQPGVALGKTETFFPGERPKLEFTARNAETVQFTATRFDLLRYIEESAVTLAEFRSYLVTPNFQSKSWRKYLQKESVRWSETLPPGQENRAVEGSTLAPLTAPGTYVVEAQVAGNKIPARVLVVVTDILLLCKNAREGGRYSNLLVACDARTGRPLPNRALRVYERWKEPDRPARKGAEHTDTQTLITNADGAIFCQRRHPDQSSQIAATMTGEDGRVAFSGLREAHVDGTIVAPADDSNVGFLITDRPVYRPGATVRYCVWLRDRPGGVYRVPTGPVRVRIKDPSYRQVQSATVQVDEAGTVSGEYTLGPKAALGEYLVSVEKDLPAGKEPQEWRIEEPVFRVEEYRQPEFEVSVEPSTTQARLGEKFNATVRARYYFGAPVPRAKVLYRIYREGFVRSYFEPGEYDGLYDKGYGFVLYPYPWLPWWERWGDEIGWGHGRLEPLPRPDFTGAAYDPRELVAQGETTLDADGKCEVEVDTARAKAEHGDHDHQYTVEATVIGTNRRAVEGTGSVVATRQAFYAFMEADRGWYAAGDEAHLRVRALTPGNVPVTVQGQVVVSRVHYDGSRHEVATEEEVQRWDAATDADGRLLATVALPDEGQYHVAFHARDAWDQEVQGNAVFWVQGPKFDGRVYRSNELELITDKRSYRVGETAHLLIHTAGDNARVIFANQDPDRAISHVRYVDVPRRTVVVDVPIDESYLPNAAVEAIVVRDGRVHTETCELVVPAETKLLNLTVHTDKDVYGPGETGTVHVEATDKAGRPAAGVVALTAFDKAVTYIRPESTTGPGSVFYGRKNYYAAETGSSFDQSFSAAQASNSPTDYSNWVRVPEGWNGAWKLGAGGQDTPLWRLLRAGVTGPFPPDRVVITGSNVPTSAEAGPPTLIDDGPAAKPGGVPARAPGKPTAGFVDPVVRTHFADTALWLPNLKLDANGKADAKIDFPQSLTTWRLHGYAVNADTQTGDAAAQATTTRKLLVRLLSPRFFTERDEVVLSAAVNNYLPDAQDVTAELTLPAALFRVVDGSEPTTPDADGNLHLTARANVAPNGEHRFDWRAEARQAGVATVTARALAPAESDGVRLTFPVEVHGIRKTLAQSGSFHVGQDGDRTLRIEVPTTIDPAQTRLEVNLSPGLAGVMIDALPYLSDSPYGCVEQTVSRFYPSVLVRDSLKRLGTDLETLGNQRRQMNPADLANRFGTSPVYDSERLERMIREGLTAVYDAKHSSGGWGWWAGEEPSLFQTAYVLQGLQAARAAGVSVDEQVYRSGFEYLWRTISAELAKPSKKQDLGNYQQQAYYAYILSLEGLPTFDKSDSGPVPDSGEGARGRWLDRLYAGRGELNNQGRALLALALHHAGREEQARTTLRNLLQFVERDDSNETARVRTPADGWWFWWNNDIETNAWALKALVALDPKNDLAPRLVKWLLNNRRNGAYWRSTRDTAQVISAMTDYLLASGEAAPDYELTVRVDGEESRNVHVTRENLFAFDNRVILNGPSLKPGSHEIVVHKQGAGALYYSCQLTYFTNEEGVKAAGNEISIERQYFKLVPQPAAPPGTADYLPVVLKDGDELASGDLLEVALKIRAKNTYDYLAFEDPKPAGCEPVEVRSGQRWQEGFCANVELRDTKTVFYVELLEQGEHFLRYRLRAETPGNFHVLPATGTAMYAPELRANADEMHLGVRE